MRLIDFKVLTFDCYGTLIDWEGGIFEALQPLLARANPGLDRDAALEAFARHETAQEVETPRMLYSALLARVQQRLAAEWGVAPDTAEAAAFGASVPAWPAFPDSVEALRYLKQHYALVILSNVDRQSFAGSNAKLGVEFDAIYTAQDIGTYKPDPRNFDYMLKALAQRGIALGQILHTAQSLFHDHVPARAAGLACAWIDRRHAAQGWGATMPPPVEAEVQFRFRSLSELAEAHRAEQALA
jgi:2-haloalkanoic acid dehalogenase type II